MKCNKSQNTGQNYRRRPKTCPDTLWIFLFLIFWCFLIVIIAFSITYGNYLVAIKGADSFGNICGQKNNKYFENFTLSATDTSKKPFLLYFDTSSLDSVVKICVENCPKYTIGSVIQMSTYFEEYSTQVCRYDFNILRATFLKDTPALMSRMGPCPADIRKCIPYRNRCTFTGRKHLVIGIYDLLNLGGLDQFFFMAVYLTSTDIAILCGFAFVVSLILLALMFWLTKLIAWLIWLLTISVNAALVNVLWSQYNKSPIEEEEEEEMLSMKEKTNNNLMVDLLDEFWVNNISILCSAILTAFIAIILIIFTLILYKQLNRLKILFEEAGTCIKRSPGLSIALVMALINMILLIILSGYTMLCLTTANYPVTKPIIEDFDLFYGNIHDDIRVYQQIEYLDFERIRRSLWIYIIGFLWTTEFIFAFEEFCIGGAVAFWYFSPSMRSPSLHAIGLVFKYHLGTIAKGSAVITLFKIPRLILAFICKCLKKRATNIWFNRIQVFEECFGIYNHNAYVPAAFESTGFREAATVAWKISTKNASQARGINNVFDLVMFLSKLCVATLTCLLGIILLKDKKENLLFYMAPVLFSTFCAFCIAHIVFSIFEMTVDTLLLCVCEDQRMYGELDHLTMKKCNLSKLFRNNGEYPVKVVKIKAIYRQPFRSKV